MELSLNLSCEDLLDAELSDHILDSITSRGMGKQVIFEILDRKGSRTTAQYANSLTAPRRRAVVLRLMILAPVTPTLSTCCAGRGSDQDRRQPDPPARQQPHRAHLCRGIVQFAQELSMQTVAEFVHNPAVLNQVRTLGIQHAQGAAIGMPSASLITEIRVLDADKPSAGS
ncbi:EAL domain-containing protein [Halopseudomonas pachastrellae]|nr:EAL domain-containing protein [Halopseudomonas pachastrellae]